MDDLKDPHIKHMDREESGQLLIEDSLLEASALYTSFHENQATKLQEAWPMVESSLKAYGISCTLNLVERYMTVSTTKRTSDPCIIDKARDLLELLSTTHVLPSLAIEILNGSQHHILVKMGDQEGGLCSKFGIKKEQFVQRRECLYSSLEELSEFGYCHLFLNECNVTAVGTSPDGLEMIRMIVEDCIVNNVCPATALRDIYLKCKPHTRPEDWKDPHNKHLEMDAVYGLPEMTSLYVVFPERKANKLEEEWPIVESCLQEYDVSCFLGDCSITLSKRTSGDLDIICKAWDLLVLLSETNVPALTSIKILKGSLQHDIIKIGLQDDGLCSRLGFKKEQYAILRRRLKHSLQKLELNLGCQLFMNGTTIVAFGTSSTLKRTRDLLEAWMIVEGSRECGASKDDVKQ